MDLREEQIIDLLLNGEFSDVEGFSDDEEDLTDNSLQQQAVADQLLQEQQHTEDSSSDDSGEDDTNSIGDEIPDFE